MGKFLDMITEEELKAFDSRRREYASLVTNNPRAYFTSDVKKILSEWEFQKTNSLLAEIFQNQLILKKEIEYDISYEELARIYSRKFSYGSNARKFCDKIDDFASAEYRRTQDENDYYKIRHLTTEYSIITNRVNEQDVPFTITLPNSQKTIKVVKGMKVMKILKRLADDLGISDLFEEARIAQSEITNQKKLKGELCLSIHPLDYSTMSDNNSDWSSCMSWSNYGCYRHGTVEMMNSPMVIVGYLASKNNPFYTGDISWNNKKWRCLFIVDNNIIISVKDYPYSNVELKKTCVNWIANILNQKDLGFKYNEATIVDHSSPTHPDTKTRFYFETNFMYNDFGSCSEYAVSFSNYAQSNYDCITINYSGQDMCLGCGTLDFLREEDEYDEREHLLMCSECDVYNRCSQCGGISDELIEIDGEELCPCCYDAYVITPYDLDELKLSTHCTDIFIKDTPFRKNPRIYIYYNDEFDYNKLFKNGFCDLTRWWSNEYYVDIDSLTEEGLKAFNISNVELVRIKKFQKEREQARLASELDFYTSSMPIPW